jgi:hypothetical protein
MSIQFRMSVCPLHFFQEKREKGTRTRTESSVPSSISSLSNLHMHRYVRMYVRICYGYARKYAYRPVCTPKSFKVRNHVQLQSTTKVQSY